MVIIPVVQNELKEQRLNTNQRKITVLSWLLLSVAGLVATLLSVMNHTFQPVFALSPLIAFVMLNWIKRDKNFYVQSFYRWSWYLSGILLLILCIPVGYWLWSGGLH